MNKELCIKVGTWDNSILWCTVEKISNCWFMFMISDIYCHKSMLAYWKLSLVFRLLLFSCQQNMPSNWIMTERNQTDRSNYLLRYRVLIMLQILTCSKVLSDWLTSHPQNSIWWSGHPLLESWRTVWQMHGLANWPPGSKCHLSVAEAPYWQRQGAASMSWHRCLNKNVKCIPVWITHLSRCTATDQQFRNTAGCKTVEFKWAGLSERSYCLGHDQYSWFKIFQSHSTACGFLLLIHCLAIFVNKYVPKVCSSLEPLQLWRWLLRTHTPNISLKYSLRFIDCRCKHIHIRYTINNTSAALDTNS